MKITKIFHSCVLIEEGNTKILIDPGTWVFGEKIAKPSDFSDVTAVLITHEHPDHLDVGSLSKIIKGNTPVISNKSVNTYLKKANLKTKILNYGEQINIDGILVEGVESPHGTNPIPMPENIGFFIQKKIFHPGDSLKISNLPKVQVYLAPVTAPWATLNNVVEATKNLAPKVVIPIHDGYIKYPFALDLFSKIVTDLNILVKAKNPGESITI